MEDILGLLDRIRSKLAAIRAAGGFDAPALPESPAMGVRDVLDRILRSDPCLLSDLEMETDIGFELEERARLLGARRAGGRAARRGPVLSVLDRPAGSAAGWLVVVANEHSARFLFTADGVVREDRASALRLLTSAAAGGPGAEHVEDRFDRRAAEAAVDAACRFLDRQGQGPGRAADPANRVARSLLPRLNEVPGGATPEQFRRADTILQRLRRGLPAGAAASLEGLPRGGGRSADGWLDALERVLEKDAGRRVADTGRA